MEVSGSEIAAATNYDLSSNNDVDDVSQSKFSSFQRFSTYQPTYFILGTNDAKLQFSAKYKLLKNNKIFIDYTQTMFWQVYDSSKPFKDVIFSPEIFYRFDHFGWYSINSIDVGYNHQSNGKDKKLSRSLDEIFVKLNSSFNFSRNLVKASLRFYAINNTENINSDIQNFLGSWDLQLLFTQFFVFKIQSLDLEFLIHAGNSIIDFNKGSSTLGLIYNLGAEDFNPSIYAQYFRGYAENLLNYNQHVDEIRLGLRLTI